MGNEYYYRLVDREAEFASAYARRLVDAYVAVGDQLVWGDCPNAMYMEIFGFANFRVETALTCLALAEDNLVADSLGLCRSLFEHYLLLILLCRGRKYYRFSEPDMTPAELKRFLASEQALLAEKNRSTSPTNCLEVKKDPRRRNRLIYVYGGPHDSNDPDFVIPIHYFKFQGFHPEAML